MEMKTEVRNVWKSKKDKTIEREKWKLYTLTGKRVVGGRYISRWIASKCSLWIEATPIAISKRCS